jgi:hypothetical protein
MRLRRIALLASLLVIFAALPAQAASVAALSGKVIDTANKSILWNQRSLQRRNLQFHDDR